MKRLKDLRVSNNQTQEEIAQLLGITRPAYSNIENGKRSIDNEYLLLLADHYNVSTDYILGRTEYRHFSYDDEKSIRTVNIDDLDTNEFETLAAHHDGDEWTEAEAEDILKFMEYVRSKRKNEEK